MKTKCAVAVLVSLFLVACGGGGGSAGGTTTPYSTFEMNGNRLGPWSTTVMPGVDGSEYMVLASFDEIKPFEISPPTPVFILKPNSDGSVANITSTYFNTPPSYYWVRNITSFTHPETGTQALWFCNQGREGPQKSSSDAPIPRINGEWGEQDGLYVMENGKFVDKSYTLPQVVDFSHGCSSMKNSEGKTSLIKNTLSWLGPDSPQRAIMDFKNGKWINTISSTWNNPGILGTLSSFFAVAGNFLKSSFGDNAVFGTTVLKSSNSSYEVHSDLRAPDLEEQGYTMIQGAVSGDFNNDGWDDLILVFSADGVILKPFLSGAKLALFRNDGKGNLVYDPTALADYYRDDEFGLDIKIMDINFDGHPDIVSFGGRYLYGTNLRNQKADKVFINNGSGKFNLKSVDLSKLNSGCVGTCQLATWFLKGKDNSSYSIMSYSRFEDKKTFYSQIVTPQNPIVIK
jgi:hypothetical protein